MPGSTFIYNIFQNAGTSRLYGLEFSFQQAVVSWLKLNLNSGVYKNTIAAFTVVNRYPVATSYTQPVQSISSGNAKLNLLVQLPGRIESQLSAIYQAPDIIPQGKMSERFSVDAGLRKIIQNGKGELILNATDLLNTLKIQRRVVGGGFSYISRDYYETQVFRIGYSYKF